MPKTPVELLKEHLKTEQELKEVAISELSFEKLQLDIARGLLEEIEQLTQAQISPNLINKVAQNGLQRLQLDRLIHSSLMFGGNPDKIN